MPSNSLPDSQVATTNNKLYQQNVHFCFRFYWCFSSMHFNLNRKCIASQHHHHYSMNIFSPPVSSLQLYDCYQYPTLTCSLSSSSCSPAILIQCWLMLELMEWPKNDWCWPPRAESLTQAAQVCSAAVGVWVPVSVYIILWAGSRSGAHSMSAALHLHYSSAGWELEWV